jgi:hypothetical protein
VLPPLYDRWMKEHLSGAIGTEKRSTCDDCAMAPKETDTSEDRAFDKNLKCCTYYPELPNYMVGAIITDETVSGRLELKRRFDRVTGLTPLGLARPQIFHLLMSKANHADVFGRAPSLRCSFLDPEGRCGIWAYREPTCFAFHCKHDRGAKGAALWKSLKELFVAVEKQLALWCVVDLDPGEAALELLAAPVKREPLSPHALEGVPDKPLMRALWGSWVGREVELYTECWRRVSSLSWEQVLAICGPDVRMHARRVAADYARHESTAIPDALRVNSYRAATVEKRTRLRTYSPTDPIDLDPVLVAALVEFDGRPTAEVLELLAARGIPMDETELRTLVNFEVLIPAGRLTKGASGTSGSSSSG